MKGVWVVLAVIIAGCGVSTGIGDGTPAEAEGTSPPSEGTSSEPDPDSDQDPSPKVWGGEFELGRTSADGGVTYLPLAHGVFFQPQAVRTLDSLLGVLDSCRDLHNPSWVPSFRDAGSHAKLTGPNTVRIDRTASALGLTYELTPTTDVHVDADATYRLAWRGSVDVGMGLLDGVEIPEDLAGVSPAGIAPFNVERGIPMAVTWTAGTADFIFISISGPGGFICTARDDGAFVVSAARLSTLGANTDATLTIARINTFETLLSDGSSLSVLAKSELAVPASIR